MTPKLLFFGALDGVGGAGDFGVTSGPAEGKRWIVAAIYLPNATNEPEEPSVVCISMQPAGEAEPLALLHKEIAERDTHVFGPFVMKYGDALLGSCSGDDGNIHLFAFGYEEDV